MAIFTQLTAFIGYTEVAVLFIGTFISICKLLRALIGDLCENLSSLSRDVEVDRKNGNVSNRYKRVKQLSELLQFHADVQQLSP